MQAVADASDRCRHATSTVKHPTLRGWRMAVVQPLDATAAAGRRADRRHRPLGGSRGDRVVITSDGKAARELIGAENSPARYLVIGLADGNAGVRQP